MDGDNRVTRPPNQKDFDNTMTASSLTTYAVVAAAVFAAWFFGVAILHILIALAVIAAIVYFVPSVRTYVFGLLGWTGTTPTQLYQAALADVEAVVVKFEDAAIALYDEVIAHKTQAAVESGLADDKTKRTEHAKKVAANYKALIAL